MSQVDDHAVVDHAKQTADPLDAGVSNHIFVCIVSSDAELKKRRHQSDAFQLVAGTCCIMSEFA